MKISKKMKFFCKKSVFFSSFFLGFVIFNMKVKELDDRKISPIFKPVLLKVLNKLYNGRKN